MLKGVGEEVRACVTLIDYSREAARSSIHLICDKSCEAEKVVREGRGGGRGGEREGKRD
jgi:hypothetical protein